MMDFGNAQSAQMSSNMISARVVPRRKDQYSQILDLYLSGHSFRKIEKITGIPRTTIHRNVHKQLKEKGINVQEISGPSLRTICRARLSPYEKESSVPMALPSQFDKEPGLPLALPSPYDKESSVPLVLPTQLTATLSSTLSAISSALSSPEKEQNHQSAGNKESSSGQNAHAEPNPLTTPS